MFDCPVACHWAIDPENRSSFGSLGTWWTLVINDVGKMYVEHECPTAMPIDSG
jgi:hypothetical protein